MSEKNMPKVLIATTSCWVPTARLAMALAKAGFDVAAVCPSRHPLRKTGVAREIYPYRGLAPLLSFKHAIATARPTIVIPGDDLATQHLHELCRREVRSEGPDGLVCALIEQSLGAPENYPLVYSRTTLMQVAQDEGVRAPKTERVANAGELENWGRGAGFPVVLKADGSFGGYGVRIAHSMQDAQSALRTLGASPLLARAAKRALADHDATLVWSSLLRRRPAVNAQAFVEGADATSTIACWRGQVLACLHFEVLQKAHSAGPATVLRLIENPEMSAAVEKMARRLKLSGIHGFDFVRETATGNAYLIEMNARATQVGHLALGPGRDLPAALYAAVTGNALQPAPKVTESRTIALYPQEWIRDPKSPFLESGYHDVPWSAPELIRECARKHGKQRAWHTEPRQVEPVSTARGARALMERSTSAAALLTCFPRHEQEPAQQVAASPRT